MAPISRLLKNIGLFFRISSLLQGSFAKETYNLSFSYFCLHSRMIIQGGVESSDALSV